VESLYKLVAREVPLKSLGGPILIAQVAGRQAEMGVSYLVQFMAALSVNLFLLNLLPIPVLDGGHLFFFTLEAIRGKPLPLQHREMAQGLGLMLILARMILVFYQDILRLVQTQY
jgi:regulator of sigma E protease